MIFRRERDVPLEAEQAVVRSLFVLYLSGRAVLLRVWAEDVLALLTEITVAEAEA